MRVAYTFNGLTGGLVGKNYQHTGQDDQPYIIRLVHHYINENILKHNDNVDFFIFSWQTEQEDLFNELYKPKKSKFQKQIKFELPQHLLNDTNNYNRQQAHYSRWYGFKEVMKLKTEYEKENNFTYDLVINVRMDILWNEVIKFDMLDTKKIHLAKCINRPYGWGSGVKENEVLDHIFAMSSYKIDKLSEMYDWLDIYTLPGQCPQWNSISHHFLTPWHLNSLGYLDKDTIEFPFGVVHDEEHTKDNAGQYSILRFRNLTIDKIKEITNES